MPRAPSPLDQLAEQCNRPLSQFISKAHVIAHKVASDYDFRQGSGSWEEIEGEAVVRLNERAGTFAPAPDVTDFWGAFWGYASRDIRTACVRCADEIRGGGTVKASVRPENRRTVASLGEAAGQLAAVPSAGGPDPVSRIKLNSALYALPFERLLRPLTGQELADLEADIDLHGVLDPLTVCTLAELGPSVIDGGHRAKIAAAKGLSVPLVDLGLVEWEFARDRAENLNALRRMMTAEEMAAARKERSARMVEDRKKGFSLRMIAEKHGVLHMEQVRRAIAEAGCNQDGTATSDTTVSEGKVKSLDGTERPASKEVTPAMLATRAKKGLGTAFKNLSRLLAIPEVRSNLIGLAEELDIPFEDDTPGREKWSLLTELTILSGLLDRVA
jgi:hypothetical protein